MTKNEQRILTRNICKHLKYRMLEKLKYAPANWDGFEIRQLLVDTASESFNTCPMDRKRMAEYKNTRIITPNL